RAAALQLAGALGWFWYTRGNHREGLRWLEEALARVPDTAEADPKRVGTRIRALIPVGRVLSQPGRDTRARAALAVGRGPVRAARAGAETYLGLGAVNAGAVAVGMRHLRAVLRRWEVLGDPAGIGKTLYYLGYAADTTGEAADAAQYYSDAQRSLAAAGDAHL